MFVELLVELRIPHIHSRTSRYTRHYTSHRMAKQRTHCMDCIAGSPVGRTGLAGIDKVVAALPRVSGRYSGWAVC